MTLDLVRRSTKGAPLTAIDHDGNLDKIEQAIEGVELAPGPAGPAGPQGPQGPAGPSGDDGREIELQTSATHVQWRYVGDVAWTNLVALSTITGPAGATGSAGAAGAAGSDGREIELQTSATHIQWRYVGVTTWTNLVALSTITGPTGATGSSAYQVAVAGGFVGTEAQWLASLVGPQGPAGPAGPSGVATAAAPITYDSDTKTVGINVGITPGTVAAGDDARFAELKARLDGFRDAATFYVSKRITASDSNNGTSEGEPFLTIGAAVTAANAYVTANPGAKAKIHVGPGRFVEPTLPFRLKPNTLAQGALQRGTVIEPAAGQEFNGFWALDSGCMVIDFTHAGHQASGTSSTDSMVGTRAWAVRLNEQANGGAGVYLTASPYVKDCASITAEDDAGLAGSTSTGDTGGGVLVDGAACRSDSPIRSMVIYGFTQQNLGGPGAVIRNDAYAELVSFFGLFGTWHVQCETGGQATLSGGGCSEFGIYGLVADGYSPTALFTGALRVAASAEALTVDVVSLSANRLGSSSRPASGQIMLIGGIGYVVQSSTPIDANGTVVADTAPTRAGYRVSFYNPSGVGLAGNVAQGASADFRQRSQISAGCHSANYVGSGTNYNALPWNGGVPIRGNEAVERNLGRVFGLIVNDVGDVRVAGGAFAVDGTTGAVTINTSQFNLSGLNAVGPFSRNGGASTVGVQLQEVSNNASLLASTGVSAADTAPTQFAVRSYADGRFLAGLTATAGQPLTITDTSTQDGSGFWTRSRNIELSLNAPNGLARLDGSGLIPSALLPSYVDDVIEAANLAAFPATGESGKIYVALDSGKSYRWGGSAYVEVSPSPGSTDAVPEGSINLYFTTGRAAAAAPVQSVAGRTGAVTLSASDISGLGTAATTAATDYATAAQGAKADSAVQPAALSSYVQTTDSRLTTDLTYDAATREVRSSTGADVALPLVTSAAAGLLPAPPSGAPSGRVFTDSLQWVQPTSGGGGMNGIAASLTF